MKGHLFGNPLGTFITLGLVALIVISSLTVMLINPSLIAAQSSGYDYSAIAPSTLSQDGGTGVINQDEGSEFTTQAALSSVTAKQSNNIVNTRSYYDITFTTGSGGSIKDIIIDFPAGTLIGVSGLLVEREGIGPGTAAKTGPLQITYTVTNPVNIPPGTMIRLELSTIDNPSSPGASYQIKVTTKRPAGTTIDGPTLSVAYKIKAVEEDDIANGAVTNSKIANDAVSTRNVSPFFVKNKILPDGEPGWNPDGMTTTFEIPETAVFGSAVVVNVDSLTSPDPICSASGSDFEIEIICSFGPAEGSELRYAVINGAFE
jgi:hypothetical protein